MKHSRILETLENIVEKAEDSRLSDEFFKNNKDSISSASQRLGLTQRQVVLLSLFIDKSDEKSITLSQIAKYLGCRLLHLLCYMEELEDLEKKRYIRMIKGLNIPTYRVPKEVIKSLTRNEPYSYKKPVAVDLNTFFDVFKRLLREKDNNELDYSSLLDQTRELLNCIPKSSLARGLKRYKISGERALLFIYMAYLLIEDNNEDIRFYEIENIYDDDEIPYWCRSELRNRTSSLFECKLIENSFEEGMGRSDSFKLTERAKDELLGDLNLNEHKSSDRGLLKYDTFSRKNLFYNSDTNDKVKELKNILLPKNFIQVQSRLKVAGMRRGFCCLFYGKPGTGKTETVYQIARATKRNILQVDVDKIKSCWVGESEKNIKYLFDRYRQICRNSKNLPILLFNEADAILGVRMEGASKAIDKMENSIQNIILQEMEKLEGIMIATTNLTDNLDKAFERRFIYKIRYENPEEEARAKIWQSLLPGLKKKDAKALAGKFDLSGGEIENIVRKHLVNSILTGSSVIDTDYICRMIQSERLQTGTPRIGF